MLILGVFLCSLVAVFPETRAEQTLLNDNFTTDNSLNSNLWQTNGPVGTAIFAGAKSAVDAGYGGNLFTLVDPNPSFSSQGMCISSINEPFRMTTLESVNFFSAPLTLQATVKATQGGGVAFCMWLAGNGASLGGFDGVLNANAAYYGIWSDHNDQWWGKLIYSSPQLSTDYQLTIRITDTGEISLTVSSNGQTIGSVSDQSIGTGPFKIVLAQLNVYSRTGSGPNQAYWKSVTLTSSSSITSPSPNPSTTTSSTPPNSPTPASSASPNNSPTPYSGSSPTPSVLPSLTPSLTSSPSKQNATSPTTISGNFFATPLGLAVLGGVAAISVSAVAAGIFIFYKLKKAKKATEQTKVEQLSLGSEKNVPEQPSTRRGLLISLLVAGISAGISDAVLVSFVTDIAKTFFGNSGPNAIGAVSQISTLNAAGVIVFTLLMSILIIKFRQKQLFLTGLSLIVISSVGNFLAPTLALVQFFYALEGAGSIMLSITAATIVGNSFPADKKAKALSYLIAIGGATALFIIPVLGFVVNLAGWRFCFTFVVLPIAFGALIVSSYALPSKTNSPGSIRKENPYIESFKLVLRNKSAMACLIASLLTVAGGQIAVFAMAFYRTQFSASRELTLGIYEVAIGLACVSYLVSGMLINKFGAKKIALLSTAINCCLTASFFFIPYLWFAFALDMTHVWFASMAAPAFIYLGLEQIPQYRGTMISLGNLFNSVGNMIAPALGGTLLIYVQGLSYGAVGIALATMTMAGFGVTFFWVRDLGYIKPKS